MIKNKKINYLIILLIFIIFEFSANSVQLQSFPYNPEAQEQYYVALKYFRRGEFEVALKHFYDVIEKYPSTEAAAKAQYMIAEALLKLNKKEEALLAYQRAIDLDSANFNVWIKLGELFEQSNDFENSLKAYKKALELIPKRDEVRVRLMKSLINIANSCFNTRDYLKAAEVYSQLISEGYDIENNLRGLARSYIYAKEYEKAERVLNELLKEYPDKYDNERFLVEFFNIYSGQGKDEEAIDLALESMRVSKFHNKERIKWELSRVYNENKKLETLSSTLEKKIEGNPNDGDLYILLANAYQLQNKTSLAIECYERALQFYPQEVSIYNSLGLLYLNTGELDKGIGCYRKIIALTPHYFVNYGYLAGNIADNYCKLGKRDDALKILKELMEMNLNSSDHFYLETVGDIYKRCEMYEAAISFYEKAVKIGRLSRWEDPSLKLNLGECYYQMDNFMEAEKLYKEVMEQSEKFPDLARQAESLLLELYATPEMLDKLINKYEAILRKYGKLNKNEKEREKEQTVNAGLFLSRIYVENQMINKGVKALERLLKIEPQRSDIYDKIGDIYFYRVSKGADNAIKWYKKAISKNPEDDHAILRLGYAYERKEMNNEAAKQYTILMQRYKDYFDIFWAESSKSRLISLKLIKEKQLIKDWLVIGPFDNTKGKGFDTIYPPEKEIDLTRLYVGKDGKQIKWFRPYRNKFGYVDFDEIFSPNEDAVAYALVYIESPEKREVQFKVGSDDTITIWLNDEQILSKNIYRPVEIDQDIVNVKLQQGRNKVLVKVCEGRIDWGFYFRITDMNGSPVNNLNYSLSQ